MNTVPATIISGLGAASGTVVLQRPHLERHFPDIRNCYDGTINVLLGYPVEIRLPDFVTPPLLWAANSQAERFGLTKIELKLDADERAYPACVYTAEFSPHLFKTGVLEILAEKIDGIQAGRKCSIGFHRLQRAKLAVV